MRVITSAWSSVASVTSQVMPSGLNTLGMPSSSCDAVGGAGDLDRHPDEVARLHQALVDQILRPVLADDDVVAADIGVEARLRVGRVEVDDRDAWRRCASLTTSTRLPGSGLVVTMPSALAAIAARTASCCEGTSPLWNEVLTVLPVSFGPLLGAGEEVGPDRIGRAAVRDPVEGLGFGHRRQWPAPAPAPDAKKRQFPEHTNSSLL